MNRSRDPGAPAPKDEGKPDQDHDPFLVLGLLASRIRSTSNLISKTAAMRFRRELDLTTGEWRSILFLGHHGPMTIGKLSEVVDVDRTLMSRLLNTMSEKGIVVRRPEKQDRRRIAIELTAHGRELYQSVKQISLQRNAALVQVLSKGELAQLETMLRKLYFVAKDWLEDEQPESENSAARP